MRKPLCDSLLDCSKREDFVFLTGDLGFMALEELRDKAGDRFINGGISEQNIVSVGAGLARKGFQPWIYSIAPFVYARPLEQIRNDVCFHDLPVRLIGNGGGYAYGVMGATHHAIEDYGVLLVLPHMNVFIPAFDDDLKPIVEKLLSFKHPAYLRLGRDETAQGVKIPSYAPWRKLLDGGGPVVVVAGPLVGSYWAQSLELPPDRQPKLWLVSELPVSAENLPEAFIRDIQKANKLLVAEEHVAHGGVGEMLSNALLLKGIAPRQYRHLCAQGYPSGFYGSQKFHRIESGIDVGKYLSVLEGMSR
jgi:transketolase